MFRFILLLIIGLFSSNVFAQQEMSIPLGNRIYEVFELTPTVSTQQFSIEVYSATSLVIDIHTAVNPVDVTIVDPSGIQVPLASIKDLIVGPTDVLPLGAFLFAEGIHKQAVINTPITGTWLVNISLPTGSTTTAGTMTVVQEGALQVGAIVARKTNTVGDPVVIAVAAFDSGVAVSGATAQANIYQEGSELTPQTIDLFDDGSAPDMQVGDGLYTGQISSLPSGDYLVETVFQNGTEKAVAGAQFEVISPLGVITNNVTDAGVDTNADGLYERIDVNVEVDIVEAGTYDLLVELKLYAKTLLKGTQVVLPAGLSTQSVFFSADDIKQHLDGDGPYEISDVRLIKVGSADGSQSTRMADRRTDLGVTQAYLLSQFQRPLTVILATSFTEAAVDTNGNAKFDVLNFSFLVDALATGSYTWSASLKALDGTIIATASQVGSLSAAGTYRFPLIFDGKTIGAAGFDGPYLLGDVGVYGPPNAAAIKLNLGETISYTASQFEGYVAPLNTAPTANSGGPYTGIDGQPIVFDGSASSDPDADSLTYAWTFGDGTSASGASPSHVYAAAGTYTVTLVVNDGLLESLAASTTVTVTPSNAVPTANPGGPYTGIDGQLIAFDGLASSDLDADPLTYAWTFGDGGTASGASPSHAYALPGTYTATLVVNDGQLNSSPASTTVTIASSNLAPIANPGGPYTGIDGQPIAFDGLASSDPDADPLTYAWTFGDGGTASGASPSHVYTLPGTYTATLVVSDGQLNSSPASTTVTITPSNFAPTANPGGPYTGLDGQPIVFDGSASSDPDADLLTYVWTFGDGSSASGANPSHVYASTGTYTIILVVNDGLLNSLPASTTVTVVLPNVAPIANAGGPYSGIVGTPIVFDGSASSDVNADVLSFSWDFGDGNTGSGVSPSHMYMAEGIYTVTLIVNDGVFTSESSITTSTVGPGNNVPVADPNGPYLGFINLPITFDGSRSSDLDGDLLSYSWDFGDGTTGTGINPTHSYSYRGFYTVSLVVNDGISNSLLVSTTVSVNNIQIDNDLPTTEVGSWRVEVGAGGESRDGWLTAVGTPSGTQFNQAEIIYDYYTYVDVGEPGGAVRLSSTVTSGPTVITSGVGIDVVRSSGSFIGENGNTVDWSVDSAIEDGSNTMENTYTFTAQSGMIGRIRLWQYLDEDVLGAGDDVFFVRGSFAELDLELFTVDNSQSIGLSHSGSLATGQGLVNSTFAGYAVCEYNQMKSAIVSGSQGISPNGELCSTLLGYPLDHPVVGPSYGPIDVVSSLAWDVDQTAVTSIIVTTLGGVPTAPVNVNQPPICSAASPSIATLWSPDHSLVPISINGVTDPEDDPIAITILSVTQDEPINHVADGDTEPDAFNQTVNVLIRSERAGNRNGRVYQIHFRADDGNGGSCTGNVQVEVPHDSDGDSVIDDGQIYNSF